MSNLRSVRDNLIACQCQIAGNLPGIYASKFPDGQGGVRSSGTFVEVGAFDGYTWSNTWPLTEIGWKGIYFEPVDEFYNLCKNRYQNNPKIVVQQTAVAAYNGTIKLYLGGSMSTTYHQILQVWKFIPWVKALVNFNRPIDVPVKTLNTLLEENRIEKEFDLLVIDVEGGETEVLAGFDIDIWKPKMVICELDIYGQAVLISDNVKSILGYMDKHGYDILHQDAINTVFWRK